MPVKLWRKLTPHSSIVSKEGQRKHMETASKVVLNIKLFDMSSTVGGASLFYWVSEDIQFSFYLTVRKFPKEIIFF